MIIKGALRTQWGGISLSLDGRAWQGRMPKGREGRPHRENESTLTIYRKWLWEECFTQRDQHGQRYRGTREHPELKELRVILQEGGKEGMLGNDGRGGWKGKKTMRGAQSEIMRF